MKLDVKIADKENYSVIKFEKLAEALAIGCQVIATIEVDIAIGIDKLQVVVVTGPKG